MWQRILRHRNVLQKITLGSVVSLFAYQNFFSHPHYLHFSPIRFTTPAQCEQTGQNDLNAPLSFTQLQNTFNMEWDSSKIPILRTHVEKRKGRETLIVTTNSMNFALRLHSFLSHGNREWNARNVDVKFHRSAEDSPEFEVSLDFDANSITLSDCHQIFLFFKSMTKSANDRVARSGGANDSKAKERGEVERTIKNLEAKGVSVYLPKNDFFDDKFVYDNNLTWNDLVANATVREQIENFLLSSIKFPELHQKMISLTRQNKKSAHQNLHSKIILFHGPPGTGKTTTAKIIANEADVPMLYISLENFLSKYYGESEKLLGEILDEANTLTTKMNKERCLLFIDEIESIVAQRGNADTHEATKRILSLLLAKFDGFKTHENKFLLIGSTNRLEDVDPAFASRVSFVVPFDLPDRECREKIYSFYACHLSEKEWKRLAELSGGFSGRDIETACQNAEKLAVSAYVGRRKTEEERNEKGEKIEMTPPGLEDYESAVKHIAKNHKKLFM